MIRYRTILALLSTLARMPLLTAEQLSGISGVPERSARYALTRLESDGLVESITYSLHPRANSKLWCIAQTGLEELAQLQWMGESPGDLLDEFPVTEQWRRTLIRRLESVAVINRLARSLANRRQDIRWNWERKGALDAVFRLPDGRSAGVVNIGGSLSTRMVNKRIGKLLKLYRSSELRAAVLIVPSPFHLQRIRYMAARTQLIMFACVGQELTRVPVSEEVWHKLDGGPPMNLELMLRQLPVVKASPAEQPQRRPRASSPMAMAAGTDRPERLGSDLSLPARRLLDLVHDWPLLSATQLRDMLDLSDGHVRNLKAELSNRGLIHHLRIGKTQAWQRNHGTRLCLGRGGLRYLADRDRTTIATLHKQWGVIPDEAGNDAPRIPHYRIKGSKLGNLAVQLAHTTGVNDVVSLFMRSCQRNVSWNILHALPADRWERAFRYGRRRNSRWPDIWHSIKPDAVLVLEHRLERRRLMFFVEYERRATNPSRMEERIRPYEAYYFSPDTIDDFPGGLPAVLVILSKREDASRFVTHAAGRSGRALPMLVSSIDEIHGAGTALGNCWKMPWRLDAGNVNPDFFAPATLRRS